MAKAMQRLADMLGQLNPFAESHKRMPSSKIKYMNI
jgi:hypothetical protein